MALLCPFQRTNMGSPSRNVQYQLPVSNRETVSTCRFTVHRSPTHCFQEIGMRPLSTRRSESWNGSGLRSCAAHKAILLKAGMLGESGVADPPRSPNAFSMHRTKTDREHVRQRCLDCEVTTSQPRSERKRAGKFRLEIVWRRTSCLNRAARWRSGHDAIFSPCGSGGTEQFNRSKRATSRATCRLRPELARRVVELADQGCEMLISHETIRRDVDPKGKGRDGNRSQTFLPNWFVIPAATRP